MKKIIISFVLFLTAFFTLSYSVFAQTNTEYQDAFYFLEAHSRIENNWKDAVFGDSLSLYGENDEKIGTLFRVYKDGVQSGYITVLKEYGVVEAKYRGEDNALQVKGNVYYTINQGYHSKEEYQQQLAQKGSANTLTNIQALQNIAHERNVIVSKLVPKVKGNYTYYSDSYATTHTVRGVPFYFSYPKYDRIYNGNAPVSGAMLFAYYSYFTFPRLFDFRMPAHHAEDIENVNFEIKFLALRFKTCTNVFLDTEDPNNCGKNRLDSIIEGMDYILKSKDYDRYAGYFSFFSTSPEGYVSLLQNGNIALVGITDPVTNNLSFVVGVGQVSAYRTPVGLYIHDTKEEEMVWFNRSLATLYIYISLY